MLCAQQSALTSTSNSASGIKHAGNRASSGHQADLHSGNRATLGHQVDHQHYGTKAHPGHQADQQTKGNKSSSRPHWFDKPPKDPNQTYQHENRAWHWCTRCGPTGKWVCTHSTSTHTDNFVKKRKGDQPQRDCRPSPSPPAAAHLASAVDSAEIAKIIAAQLATQFQLHSFRHILLIRHTRCLTHHSRPCRLHQAKPVRGQTNGDLPCHFTLLLYVIIALEQQGVLLFLTNYCFTSQHYYLNTFLPTFQ